MKFKIETILSVTHDHLLCEIGNVYGILNYFTDDKLYTHQLIRARKFCMQFILQQHPTLSDWDIYDAQVNQSNWREYADRARTMFGSELEIVPAPSGVWTEMDPVEEAKQMWLHTITVQLDGSITKSHPVEIDGKTITVIDEFIPHSVSILPPEQKGPTQ